jgi:hypothetical protein
MDRNNGASAAKGLIYGGYRLHQSFAVLDETQAEGLAREVRAVQACTTVGQARELASKLQFTRVPNIDVDEKDDEQLPDDAPYDWSRTGAAEEGDWPPMPDQVSLENLPADLRQELINKAGARIEFTALNGDFLAIPLDREDDLVNVLRSAGYDVHKNDELIGIIGLNDHYVAGPEDQI